MKDWKTIIIGVLFLAVGFLLVRDCKRSRTINTLEDVKDAYSILQEDHKVVKNKFGETAAKVRTLQTKNVNLLEEINLTSKTNIKLKETVKAYKKELKDGGKVTIIKETIKTDTLKLTPTNEGFIFSDEWITLLINPNNEFDLTVSNEYKIVSGVERYGFLNRKTKAFTEVTNSNPYSIIEDLKSFEVKVPRKKFSISINGGYGAFLHKGTIKTGPGVLVGIGYNF